MIIDSCSLSTVKIIHFEGIFIDFKTLNPILTFDFTFFSSCVEAKWSNVYSKVEIL